MIFAVSFVLGCLGAWFIGKYGYIFGILDVPNERSSHNHAIPKGGGIGILVTFVFSGIYLNLPFYFWGIGSFLSFVSLCGDKREIRPRLRLKIHFVCCIVFLMGYFYSIHASMLMYLLILPLSVFIAGTLNFYNFMDGINGIAGISGFIAFALMAVWGLISGAGQHYIFLCGAIAFSCLGFLPFNIPIARVFMGDIGSVLLGFAFACMVVVMSDDISSFMCIAAFLFPFYIDELSTMIIRIKTKQDLTKPHRNHIYQILANEMGIPHWKISASFGIVQLIVGISAMIVEPYGFLPLIIILLFYSILSVLFSLKVRWGIKTTNIVNV